MKLQTPALIALATLLGVACDAPSVTPAKGGGAGGGGNGAPGSDASSGMAIPPNFVPPTPPDGGYPEGGVMGTLGEGPQCAQKVEKAKLTPVDLLLLMDASGSMAEPVGAKNRWEMARDAVAAFLKDDRSAVRHNQACPDQEGARLAVGDLAVVDSDESRSLRTEYLRSVDALRGIASGALIAAVPHGCTQGIRPASSSAMILSVISV